MGGKAAALRAAPPVGEGAHPDQGHRHGGEQEGRTDDRPDRHPLGAALAADHRNNRDQRLWHRGPDRGQQASHRPFPHRQPVAEPLDGVGEKQRPGEDHGKAGQEKDSAHRCSHVNANAGIEVSA
jgi:hypothetical protein